MHPILAEAIYKAGFRPSLHPRAANGRFAPKRAVSAAQRRKQVLAEGGGALRAQTRYQRVADALRLQSAGVGANKEALRRTLQIRRKRLLVQQSRSRVQKMLRICKSRPRLGQLKAAIRAGDQLGYDRQHTIGTIKFGPDGMTPEAKLARAKAAGFRLDMDLFHGGGEPIKGFQSPKSRQGDPRNPRSKAIFLAPGRPDVASHFAGSAQATSPRKPNILRLVHRAKNPARLTLDGSENNHEVAATLEDAFRTRDAVMLENYSSVEGLRPAKVLAVRDPEQLRARGAVFNPSRLRRRNLMA